MSRYNLSQTEVFLLQNTLTKKNSNTIPQDLLISDPIDPHLIHPQKPTKITKKKRKEKAKELKKRRSKSKVIVVDDDEEKKKPHKQWNNMELSKERRVQLRVLQLIKQNQLRKQYPSRWISRWSIQDDGLSHITTAEQLLLITKRKYKKKTAKLPRMVSDAQALRRLKMEKKLELWKRKVVPTDDDYLTKE